MEDRTPYTAPPSNIEAEEAVLGALLIDPDAFMAVSPILGSTGVMFHVPRNSMVYAAIAHLDSVGKPADLIVLTDYLEQIEALDEIGGPPYLTGLINATPTSIYATHYAQIIRRDHILRRLIDASGEIAKMAYNYDPAVDVETLLGKAEEWVYRIRGLEKGEVVEAGEAADKLWDQIERQLDQPNFVPGWHLGIQNVDSILGFVDPGRQIVIASRPGMGKTSTLLKIFHNLAVVNHEPVLLFSYEMGEVEIMRRLVALDAGINSRKLKNPGQLSDEEIRRVQASLGRITNSPLYFGPTGDINTVRAVARRQSAQALAKWGKPLAAVGIDYLQLMAVSRTSRAGNRDQEIGEITRALKNTARELHCMVFTLSQLNRLLEQTQSHLPNLSHLRESGNIEADADIVIFPFPPAAYMNPTDQQRELAHYEAGWEPYKQIVAKWRDGAIGIAECLWNKSTGEIRSLVRR